MPRVVLAAAVLALLVAGCGSEAAKPETAPPASASASQAPEPPYFQQAESDRLNKAVAPAMEAVSAASNAKNVKRCNDVAGYPAWRRCLHRLLDPAERGLTQVSSAFAALSARPFPAKCVTRLARAARSFASLSESVSALATGFDSNRATARTRAANSYGTTLEKITKDSSKPFISITQACYSPEVLASLKASPSASPSASPGQ